MSRVLLGLLLISADCLAVTKTVCASGCNYSTLTAALVAVKSDCTIDTLSLSLETFTSISAPFQTYYRPCSTRLTVQSSAVGQLPPIGTRVGIQHASLMPTLTNNTGGVSLLAVGFPEMLILAADTSGDWLTLSDSGQATTSQVAIGTALSFTDRGNGVGFAANPQPGLPAPLQRSTKYYVVATQNVAAHQLDVKVSLTLSGSAVHITSTAGINTPSSSYYFQPQASLWDNPSNITFRGLNFIMNDPGANNNVALLVTVGGAESSIQAIPQGIIFEQCLFWRGDATFLNRGLATPIVLNCVQCGVYDSYLEAIGFDGVESHGISMQQCQGCEIVNNQIASVGGGVFFGGAGGSVPQLMSDGVRVEGNYFSLPGWMFVQDSGESHTTNPAYSSCYYAEGSGSIFIDRTGSPSSCSGGACQVCQANGTWAADTAAQFRTHISLAKARVEIKAGQNITVRGNVISGNVVSGDQGNTGCIALVLTEQSLIDGTGTFYFTMRNILVEHNWCDRVFSGFLMGQDAQDVRAAGTSVTTITEPDSATYQIGATRPFGFSFLSGVTGTGNQPYLNYRFLESTGVDGSHYNVAPPFTANGSYSGGGTSISAIWPAMLSVTFRNNLISRVAQQQLNPFPLSDGVQARPHRQFAAHQGGPVSDKNTIRQDSDGAVYFGTMFERQNPPQAMINNEAAFTNSIMASSTRSYYDSDVSTNCTMNGYGGFYQNAAAFSHLLMAGATAGWPNPGSGCSDQTNLKTAASDAAVQFVGSNQSIMANSKLASGSAYSAANGSPTMLNKDGTDLGADIDAIAQATSGAVSGTQPWALSIDVGSGNVVFTLSGSASWTVTLYNAPARIAGNLVSTTIDSCGGCIIDGQRRQIPVSTFASTTYYFKATDGTKTLVGQVKTLAAGGSSTIHVTGSGLRYSANRSMSSPTSAPTGAIPVSGNSLTYYDHGSGTPVSAVATP